MTMKLSVLYSHTASGATWSESYYRQGTDHEATIEAWSGAPQVARLAILARGNKIYSIKTANVNPPPDGRVSPRNLAGTYAEVPVNATNEQSLPPEIACGFRLYSGSTSSIWRSMQLRGLPSGALTTTGTLLTPSPWVTRSIAFAAALAAAGFGIYHRVYIGTSPLIAVGRVDSQIVTLTTAAAIPDVDFTTVLIVKNALGISNVNGLYRVLRNAGAGLYIVRKRRRKSYGDLVVPSGEVWRLSYEDSVFSRGAPTQITSRKTLNPTVGRRGRSLVHRD